MSPDDQNQDQINAWVKTFTGIDASPTRPQAAQPEGTSAKAKPLSTAVAKPVSTDAAQPDNTEDLQNEIADGLHHVEASIAALKAGHAKTKRLEAGYQSVVKARDTAFKVQVAEYRAKALGKVFVSLSKLVIEAQDAVNAANKGGAGGTAADSDRLSKQIDTGLQELDKIAASLKAVHADPADILATRKTLGNQSDGTRQIQDDGARAKALEQLAQRVTAGVENARAQLKGAETVKPAVTDEQVAAADHAVQDLLKQLRDQVAKAKQAGMDVKQMETEQPELEKSRGNALRLEGNAAKAKSLSTLMARLNGELRHAHALADAVAGMMEGQKGPPTEQQKSQIYQAALESGYNLKIKNDGGMKNTHLDQVFDMLGSVPPADAMQGRLKQLKYDKKVGGGEYDETTNAISMGDLGDGKEEESYQVGGKTVKANSFNVTTLHEIGHSVDTRHGIMKSHMSKPGCGGWEEIKPDKLVEKLVGLMKQSLGLGSAVSEKALAEAVQNTLATNKNDPPKSKIPEKEWDKIGPWLHNFIVLAREKQNPWEKTREAIGGRHYHEAYENKVWVGYDVGARPATEVSKYQWRSPDEWFAELYAITWLTKKPPPSGVDAAVAGFLWKPS